MKPIHDPDDLQRGVDIEYDTKDLVIYIRAGHAIDERAGLTGQVLCTFTREEWRSMPEGMDCLLQYEFPFEVTGCVDAIIGLRMSGGWTIDPYGLHLLRRTFLKAEYREDADMCSTHGVLAPYSYVSKDMQGIKFYE